MLIVRDVIPFSLLSALCRVLLFRPIIGLNRFRLDDHAGVGFLPELASGRHRPRHIAGGEAEGGSEGGQGGDEHRDDDFDDLLFGHNSECLVVVYSEELA